MPLPTLPLGIDGWCLRAWRAADAESLARYANNERVWRNMSEAFPHPYSLALAQHWVDRGHIDFGGDAEIGYWLGEPFWGRGVVTQVARVLTEQAFARPEVTRVFAPVHADNPASMRVLQKNGFYREAELRRSALKAGHVIDRVQWARLREP
ncbi:MAG: GNAT family N-acetyltransferase [Burkholderiaceae bacterium]|nr:GNAT family N-acetyltransferase [Burkholderiaceae bacterium]